MEAVEDLVVGEDAAAGGVVDESFVDGAVDGLKVDAVAAVLEDDAEAFELLGVVAENQQFIAFGEEIGEGAAD